MSALALSIRLFARAVHLLAAAAWVGGSLMYLVTVVPALRSVAAQFIAPRDSTSPVPAVAAKIAILFKQFVNMCIAALLLSGIYLIVDRLSQTTLGWPYLVVLVLKIMVALGMFVLAIYLGQSNVRRLAKRATRLSKAAPQLILALGILVFVLGALLNILFELAIAAH